MPDGHQGRAEPPRGRGWLRFLAGPSLALASLLLVASIGEAALRLFPRQLLPQGTYGAGRLDPELGLNVAASTVYHQKVRFVHKRPNSRGFMDVEHEIAKPPGTLRIGFFGDSYVESNSVPLEQAFFRLLPGEAPDLTLEPFAFGISGWGTLHAFMTYQVKAPLYDLDRVVYLFVENDPADNSYAVSAGRRLSPLPLAESSEDPPGYAIRRPERRGSQSVWLPIAKALQRHSLVSQLLFMRFRLLREQGVRLRARPEDREMSGRAHGAWDSAAVPATWPAPLREEAARVGRAILAEWKRVADADGRDFSVLYVPRSEAQLDGTLPEADTWLPWLREACGDLSIRLVDPSDALRRRQREGVPVYDDHWSPEGHVVVARVLAEDLRLTPGPRAKP